MNTYQLRGFNKLGTKFLFADIEAENQAQAFRKFREKYPEAGSMSCRPPRHIEQILETLCLLPITERQAA